MLEAFGEAARVWGCGAVEAAGFGGVGQWGLPGFEGVGQWGLSGFGGAVRVWGCGAVGTARVEMGWEGAGKCGVHEAVELSLRVIQGLWGEGMALDWGVGKCRGTEGSRGCQDLGGTGQGEWSCWGWDRSSTWVLFWGDGVRGLPLSLMWGVGLWCSLFFHV